MNKLGYIAKSVNVLNALLLFAFAVAANEILLPFVNLNIPMVLPAIRRSTAGSPGHLKPPLVSSFSPADYAAIGEQNLFHPERRIPPEKKAVSEAAVVPKPDLILYGTLVADNLSIAYVEDRKSPYSTPGRTKRQRQMKKGESINGYVLQEIGSDRIVLVKDQDRLVVSLYDKDKARQTDTAPTTAASASGSAAPRPVAPVYSPAANRGTSTAATAPGYGSTGYGYRPTAATAATAPGYTTPTTTTASGSGASASGTGTTTSGATASSGSNPTATADPSAAIPPTSPDTTATPNLNPQAAKLPPRSHALSDMLTITPNAVRRSMGGN